MDFQPGDIVLVRDQGFSIVRLTTNMYWNHALILDEVIDGDYGILESIAKGVACGLLSFYEGSEIAVYRYKGITAEQQQLIRHAARKEGRYRYDYFVPFRVIARLGLVRSLGLLFQLWRKEIPAIPHIRDSYVVCSELVQESYQDAGIPLILSNFLLIADAIPQNAGLQNIWRGKWIV